MRELAVATLLEPPFPGRVNAHAGEAGRRSIRWAAELGLVSTADDVARLARVDTGDLAGRTCPNAVPDPLRLVTDLFTWLFVFDDRCDDDGLGGDPARLAPVVGRLLDVLDLLGCPGPGTSGDADGPLELGLRDLCGRIREQAPPHVLLHFAGQFREYLLGLLWEAANRERRRIPAVAEYQQMRRYAGGALPGLALIDLAHGGLPGPGYRADPGLSTLDRMAVDLVCWCNDVFSYEKERRQGLDGLNLVTVLARGTGRATLAAAADRFNTGLRAYLVLEAEVLAGAEPDVVRFLTSRRCWIRGTYDWSLGAGRYQ